MDEAESAVFKKTCDQLIAYISRASSGQKSPGTRAQTNEPQINSLNNTAPCCVPFLPVFGLML
jgi:hypothetical protein